jgi:uncharacterized protein YndB with AHSA1/START domain
MQAPTETKGATMTTSEPSVPEDGTTMEVVGEAEIRISRTFDAPARIVFEALHRPENVRRWWAPRSRGEMTLCEIDLRKGGGWRFQMKTVRGDLVGFHGTYLEIDAPHRVVSTEVFDPFPDAGSTVTLTLVEKDGRTTMTQRCVYPSREVRDLVISTGMEDGMRESLRQLHEVVTGLSA